MKDRIVQFAAIIDKIETMHDKSLKLKVITSRETTEQDKTTIFSFHQIEIWMALKMQELEPEDIKVRDERVEKASKSQSQRLRAVLYVWWEQKKSTTDFESFYRTHMERIIQQVKDKLDEPET